MEGWPLLGVKSIFFENDDQISSVPVLYGLEHCLVFLCNYYGVSYSGFVKISWCRIVEDCFHSKWEWVMTGMHLGTHKFEYVWNVVVFNRDCAYVNWYLWYNGMHFALILVVIIACWYDGECMYVHPGYIVKSISRLKTGSLIWIDWNCLFYRSVYCLF